MIRSNGRPFNRKRVVNVSEKKLKSVQELFLAGMPIAQISRVCCVSRLTIYRWAEKFQWKRH